MLEPVEIVKIFDKNGSPKTFSASQTIFEQGQSGDIMYGIVSGEVELWVNGKVVETITKGDIFGQGALVQADYVRASTAIAKTDCELVTLDRERFLFAVQETPVFALQVMKSFSNRLRALKEHL